jgi:hypothetical protein
MATDGPDLSPDQVWRQIEKGSFAVLSEVTSAGEPRSSGVLYTCLDRRLYVLVAPDSWKARHLSARGKVAMTIPVRRGGLLTLLFPIPPATINLHGEAIVHPPGAFEVPERLGSLAPAERLASGCIVEIRPVGRFLTYGIGVSLMRMRDIAASHAHVPVGADATD